MLVRKEYGNHVHIYSDIKGVKIKQIKTGYIFSEAIETKDCHYQNEYVEVVKND